MEIVSGLLRNLILVSPRGMEVTRPTAVRARQSLFDSLGPLAGYTAADLFAGSGALGLEAASRGAECVLFADDSAAACKAIRTNIAHAQKMSCTARLELVQGTLPAVCSKLRNFPKPDLVFADPPYAQSAELLQAVLGDAFFTEWAKDARIIWECASDNCSFRPPPLPWNIENVRLFGGAKFLIFKQG